MGYIDRAYLRINGEDIPCSSIKRDQSDSGAAVKTMNPENRAKGFSRGVVEYQLDVDFPLDRDSSIDPEEMHEDGEEFTTVVEEEGGKTIEYSPCRFMKVAVASQDGSESKFTASITALDRVVT